MARRCLTHRHVWAPDDLVPDFAPPADVACGVWCPEYVREHASPAGDVNDLAELLTDPRVRISSTGSYLDAEPQHPRMRIDD